MLKINQRVSGLRFTSLGGGGTNGETKRPCRFCVHTPLSCRNETRHTKSASVTALPLVKVACASSLYVDVKRCTDQTSAKETKAKMCVVSCL